MKITIKGIQEAQDKNLQRIAKLKPSSLFGQVIKDATIRAHRYAAAVTHVDTGALRASHRMQVKGLRGRIYIDPSAKNPRSGQRTAIYGPHEHARGGEHAFYRRVLTEQGADIAKKAAYELRKII